MSDCVGRCANHVYSATRCAFVTVGRNVLGCPFEGVHIEHDWHSARSGRIVHCYGKEK